MHNRRMTLLKQKTNESFETIYIMRFFFDYFFNSSRKGAASNQGRFWRINRIGTAVSDSLEGLNHYTGAGSRWKMSGTTTIGDQRVYELT